MTKSKDKISETFLSFLEPAFEFFGNPNPRTNEHDAACALGHAVWNAVIMEEQNPGGDYIRELKEKGGSVPEINQIIDLLVERKKTHFGSDMRMLGVYDIRKKGDNDFSLWATAYDGERLN